MKPTQETVAPKELETRDIGIAGMTCDHCSRKVEKVLRSQPGVTSVHVNRAAALATVTFDPTKTDVPAMHEALLQSGYRPTATAG
jgi:Cu+-exporting ATPase